jgi:hypothetical protein
MSIGRTKNSLISAGRSSMSKNYLKNGAYSFLMLMVVLITQDCTNTDEIVLPEIEPVELQPYAKINFPEINETSGLVKSRLWDDVFWTHNDSGDEARIFPIKKDGTIIKPEWMKKYVGIQIPDAVNVDWESITTDEKGHLYIGDFGNNSNTRRDLIIYVIEEPYPTQTVVTNTKKRILYYYPDQKSIPAEQYNYDAEAMFWKDGKIYILTKHRGNTYTKLYRLDTVKSMGKKPAKLIDKFNIHGQVSGVDISPDGSKLAVLTYTSVWLFETSIDSDNYFSGKISWLPYKAEHCEAISVDGNELIIANERGDLFSLEKDDLIVLRK